MPRYIELTPDRLQEGDTGVDDNGRVVWSVVSAPVRIQTETGSSIQVEVRTPATTMKTETREWAIPATGVTTIPPIRVLRRAPR